MNMPLPNPLRALLPLAGRALELALNRALKLDPDTADKLRSLQGQHIELHLEAPPLSMAITVRADGSLQVGPADAAREADLSLRATLGAVLGQLMPSRDDAAPVGKLKISGDAELARRLQKLAKGFDPDFDAAFAGVFGDVLGVQIARMLREGLQRGRGEAVRLARDLAEYLVEERRDVVSRTEQSAFFDDVDDLRDGVERMAKRVERLRSQVGGA